MSQVTMLTTIDNPYDPFTQYNEWYAYDVQHGYNTAAFLARLIPTDYTSLALKTDEVYQDEIEKAVDEAVHHNITGLYKKVVYKD